MHRLIVERSDLALLKSDLMAPSQKLLGIISFVAMHVRPDSYFSCNFLSGFANPRHMTQRAFDAIVRVWVGIFSPLVTSTLLFDPKGSRQVGIADLE